ncbi:MAG: chloride channel protein [Archaeoglobi archaeon]|nr:chloride channel protein [Candidatus Mnemosynella bozhongmuii]
MRLKKLLWKIVEYDLPFIRIEKMFILSIVVGLLSGSAAILLYTLLDLFTQIFLLYFGGLEIPSSGGETSLFHIHSHLPEISHIPYQYAAAPVIGALLTGLTIHYLAPEASSSETDVVIRAFHTRRRTASLREIFARIILPCFTVGSGGSAGREGPTANIGAAIGIYLSNLLRLSEEERRTLLICGVAGGVGAIFKAPFGGALFAIEVLYREDMEVEAIIPAFISSIVSYSLFASVFGWTPIFSTPRYYFSPEHLIGFAVLGVLAAVLSRCFIRLFEFTKNEIFGDMGVSMRFRPALGAIFLIPIVLSYPQVMGMGYGWVQEAINGNLDILLLVVLIFMKMFATSFTVGSGGSGGVFAPSIFIGGMLGALTAELFGSVFPEFSGSESAFAVVGMGAFLTGIANVPLTAIVMIAQMCGNFDVLVPLMTSVSITYALTKDVTIYPSQVKNRAESPVHRRELAIDILEFVDVKSAFNPDVITLSPEDSCARVLELFEETGHHGYPVVDENGRVVGVITVSDVERIPEDRLSSVKVRDIMSRNVITVHPEESLEDALRKMVKYGIGRLIVTDRKDRDRIIGILTRSDIVKAHCEMAERIISERKKPGIMDFYYKKE